MKNGEMMSTISSNGISVGYDDSGGSDPALLLVHGHPFDRTMWRDKPPGWRVIAPDLRGYGATTTVPGKTTLDIFASDLVALLDHLGIDKVVIGGLSMGGQIVMEFYRLFPERVRGLILADTSPRAETADGKAGRIALADRLLSEGMSTYAAEALPMMMAPANIDALPEVADHVLGMMRGTDPVGAAAAMRGRAERPDYVSLLATVTVPALVIVGSDDEFTPVSEAMLIHQQVPESTMVIVDGAGHLPNLERPREFDSAVQQFLHTIESEHSSV